MPGVAAEREALDPSGLIDGMDEAIALIQMILPGTVVIEDTGPDPQLQA